MYDVFLPHVGTYPNSPSTSTNSSVPVRLTSSPEEMEEQDDTGQNTEGTPFRIGGILVSSLLACSHGILVQVHT